MADRINASRFGLSFGIAGGIISLICGILLAIAPSFTISLFGAIFHGIDLSQIASKSVGIGGIILGIIEVFIIGYIFGWLVGVFYNKFN
ncbi:hypothetical protein J4447_04910 [Candidatus Pacearchaeota archaeon]|nr:hypothetical protein [Candidatus Pacearchaeota archaeon]